MKAVLRKIRILIDKPTGYLADGRPIGLGLATAQRSYGSAEDADRYLHRWSAEQDTRSRSHP